MPDALLLADPSIGDHLAPSGEVGAAFAGSPRTASLPGAPMAQNLENVVVDSVTGCFA